MNPDDSGRDASNFVPTGIEGLDEILCGGLTPHGLYLVDGDPGSGKTTLAMQFLLEGVKRGERCMFVTLAEEERELRAAAASHGWSLEAIHIFEILASEESLKPDDRLTMYHPSEVELAEATKAVLAEAARIKPDRMVLDSLSEFRMLAESALRYRRQVLALKRYFARQKTTLLFIDDTTGESGDIQLHSSAQGVISLGRQTPEFGSIRRQLQVIKMRGRRFSDGHHDFVIRRGGLQVFPRLVAADHKVPYAREAIKSGIDHLDALLGGGLARGTSTLLIGAAGTGKSSLASQFASAAAKRGEHPVVFLFDESVATFMERSAGFGMHLEGLISGGELSVRQVDPCRALAGRIRACDARRRGERKHTNGRDRQPERLSKRHPERAFPDASHP
jgi:circadian clock protein KaiC